MIKSNIIISYLVANNKGQIQSFLEKKSALPTNEIYVVFSEILCAVQDRKREIESKM